MGSFPPLGHWKLFPGGSISWIDQIFISPSPLLFLSLDILLLCFIFFILFISPGWCVCVCVVINTSSRLDTAERWMKARGRYAAGGRCHCCKICLQIHLVWITRVAAAAVVVDVLRVFSLFLVPSVRFVVTCQPSVFPAGICLLHSGPSRHLSVSLTEKGSAVTRSPASRYVTSSVERPVDGLIDTQAVAGLMLRDEVTPGCLTPLMTRHLTLTFFLRAI